MKNTIIRLLNYFGISVRPVVDVTTGDRILFNTTLLEEIQALPNQRTVIVRVNTIRENADGTKEIWVTNVDTVPAQGWLPTNTIIPPAK